MRKRLSLIAASAVLAATGLASHAAAAGIAITSKETLYCELETPKGSSSCLFPVTVTKWPSWVPDDAKKNILSMEAFSSDVSSLISGVSAVQSAINSALTLAANLGLYTPPISTEQRILTDVDAILALVEELRILQQLTYDGLYLQHNLQFIDDSRGWAATAGDDFYTAYVLFSPPGVDPESAYSTCLASGVEGCLPIRRSDLPFETWATAATHDIDFALSRLDVDAPLDPVWLDNGSPQWFDPRLAVNTYLSMVAQELHILSWEVGPQRLPTFYRERLLRRARFINQVLIPSVKDWVNKRCESGPHVPSPYGIPSPLGTRFAQGTYFSKYYRYEGCGAHWEYYFDGTWTKDCDYSSAESHVFWCVADPGCSCLEPMPSTPAATNPYHKGDSTEVATLERIGLNNWSYQAAQLVGLANGASYAGCFSLAGTQAILPHLATLPSVTVAACIDAARSKGDDYAQLTVGECHTGKGIGQLVRIPDAQCDSPCYTTLSDGTWGPSGEMCGGSNYAGSSVYRVASSPDLLVASNVVGGKTSYVGCYQPLDRVTQTTVVASADACLQAAVNAKVVYASVEPGGVCKLANTLAAKAPLGEAQCTSPCPATSGQVCGGVGAGSVFITNDPMPLTCMRGTADCNGVLTDRCETNTTLAANCGACDNICAATEYCAFDLNCHPATLKSYSFPLNQAVAFTGTSATTGYQGAFVPVTGAVTDFSMPPGVDVTVRADVSIYLPSGPSDMSVDLRLFVDGYEKARTRFRPGPASLTTTLTGLWSGSHTIRVEARTVLNYGPPATVWLMAPADIVASVVRK